MYVLNITLSIEKEIFDDWMVWYQESGEAFFSENPQVQKVKFFNLIGASQDEEETRCLHLEFASNQALHQFYVSSFKQITELITNKFGQKCLYFASVLELLQEK